MMVYTTKVSFLFFLLLWATTASYGETTSNESQTEQTPQVECSMNQDGTCVVEQEEDASLLNVQDPQPPAPAAIVTTGAREEKLLPIKKNELWNAVLEQQGNKPFGKVLDAGTGINSMNFLASLVEYGMTSYTAVTGSKTMLEKVQQEAIELNITDLGDIIYGNWFDEKDEPLEMTETYDMILVDYLIGAMDAFSPYMQDVMLSKLVSYLNPGGRVYVVALEPIPDFLSDEEKEATNSIRGANMVCQMKHLRDSCVLLAGRRIYREFPLHWMERQLNKLDEMEVLHTQVFPATWNTNQFTRQLDNGRMYLDYFPSRDLAQQMAKELNEIERAFYQTVSSLKERKVKFGSDYFVCAEKKKKKKMSEEDEVNEE